MTREGRTEGTIYYLPQSYLYFVKKKKNDRGTILSDTFQFLIFFHTIKKTIEVRIRYESANRRYLKSRAKNHRETTIISRTSSPFNFQLHDTCITHNFYRNTRTWIAQRKKSKKPNFNRGGKLLIVDFSMSKIGRKSQQEVQPVCRLHERLAYTLVEACARAPRSTSRNRCCA